MAASLASTPYPVNARPPTAGAARLHADRPRLDLLIKSVCPEGPRGLARSLPARLRVQSGHIDEMGWLATRQGVPSFESYDLAHFEFIMLAASRIRRAHLARAPRLRR